MEGNEIKPTRKMEQAFYYFSQGYSTSKAMVLAEYSPSTAKNPKNLTESKGWAQLMEKYMDDDTLAAKHKQILNARSLDSVNFPKIPIPNAEGIIDVDYISDEQIKEMLDEIGCKVRRIVHGKFERLIYFWAPDNKAQKDALDMAYKLKGKYAPEKHANLNINKSEIEVSAENIDLVTKKVLEELKKEELK